MRHLPFSSIWCFIIHTNMAWQTSLCEIHSGRNRKVWMSLWITHKRDSFATIRRKLLGCAALFPPLLHLSVSFTTPGLIFSGILPPTAYTRYHRAFPFRSASHPSWAQATLLGGNGYDFTKFLARRLNPK